MKLRFLGAATTVTGSQFLLTTERARVIIDCGMFQGAPAESARNRLPLAYDPRTIDAIVLTHAHLDHCGYLPVVVREGYAGTVWTTHPSVELVRLVLVDSGKVQAEQAKVRRRRAKQALRNGGPGAPPPRVAEGDDHERAMRGQPPVLQTESLEPLYDVDDAEAACLLLRGTEYATPIEVAPGVTATFHDAGHILGSAIIVLDVEEGGTTRRIVFSGDLGRPGTPILRDPESIMGGADVVVMETTYGGREHEETDESARLLAEAVNAAASGRGVLLIPAFAIGRTQEIVWELDRLVAAGAIPHVPLYLDSPMASSASDIYRRYPGYYDEETFRLLQAGETPLDYPGQVVVTDGAESRAIRKRPRPMIIVASSGMLTGGRVVGHLRDLIDDPSAILLFVGYQGEGTLGAHLQAGARQVWLDGEQRPVRCAIRTISGFSAHADESELLDWLGSLARATRKPQRVFLVHGDPDAAEAIEPKVQALGLATHRPAWREEVELP